MSLKGDGGGGVVSYDEKPPFMCMSAVCLTCPEMTARGVSVYIPCNSFSVEAEWRV